MLAFAYPRKYMNTNERERHPRYYAKELFDGVVVERVGRQIEQGCVGRCSRFINEYKLSYVHPRQCFSPCSPRLLHVLALLLAGMQSFFEGEIPFVQMMPQCTGLDEKSPRPPSRSENRIRVNS
jgi:hypothetical protein